MYRLIAFDLDKTLADLGKGITQANIDKLKYLESRGATIAICSGKPTYYLCGFMRQIGLKKPVLIGENGACIQFGVDLPPQEEVIVDYPAQTKSALAKIRLDLCAMFSDDIWLQPNAVCVTPFPKSRKAFERIQRYVDDSKAQFASVCVFVMWTHLTLSRWESIKRLHWSGLPHLWGSRQCRPPRWATA